MEVILLERVDSLGSIGDVVRVRNGFARNYLLPLGKALLATENNRRRFDAERAVIIARNDQARAAAEAEGRSFDGAILTLIRQAGDTGQLYGSVSSRDVSEAAAASGHAIERRMVLLNQPIKSIGLHPVSVRLHPEVTITVTVNVARSADEAERQARGENVIEAAFAEDRAQADAQAAELAAIAAEVSAERGGED